MSLTGVKMSEEVWLTCLTHALSTEKEEIMGLLLGDIQRSENGSAIALIWGASPQKRSDRQKDRVETNPEQLTAASAQAERMTLAMGRTTRVIGWYHSHPHITILPSHVDVKTQAMYQLLDSGFVGLIFSCFSEDSHKVGRIQVIAFQSLDGNRDVSGPVSLSPSVIDLETFWGSAENMSVIPARVECGEEYGTDSGTTLAITMGEGKSSAKSPVLDTDKVDLSESMQEAMHRSNLDASSAEYGRKEIPLHVLPTSSLVKLDSPLSSFVDLQRVLYEEEREAYNQAILQNMRGGKVHPLTFIHHTSTYQASICKLIEHCLSPAINALQERVKENEIQFTMLSDEARILQGEASRARELSSGSPPNVAFRRLGSQGSPEPFSVKNAPSPGRGSGKGS